MVQVGVFNSDVQVGGTASFNVDFGAGTINTDLALTTSNNVLGTFNGSGTISGNQFSGSFTTSNVQNFVGGAFNGGFYGPAAQEMGYAFTIKEHNPDPFAGASPAPTDTLISGVVVGKK
jgi:hypothetical protein